MRITSYNRLRGHVTDIVSCIPDRFGGEMVEWEADHA